MRSRRMRTAGFFLECSEEYPEAANRGDMEPGIRGADAAVGCCEEGCAEGDGRGQAGWAENRCKGEVHERRSGQGADSSARQELRESSGLHREMDGRKNHEGGGDFPPDLPEISERAPSSPDPRSCRREVQAAAQGAIAPTIMGHSRSGLYRNIYMSRYRPLLLCPHSAYIRM